MISPERRAEIVSALRSGMPQNQAAKRFGVGVATVNRIAHSENLEYSAPQNANLARVDYAQANRLQLLNAGFDKAQEMLDQIRDPHQLQQWSVAIAVLIDKRRLEDGEATSRSEVSNADDARSRLASRLDDLAQRRAAKQAAG